MLEYYLKIKLSCFDSGFTIPKEYIDCFIQNEDIPLSSSRKIKLVFQNKEYDANILYANIKKGKPYYSLRFGTDFIRKLKEEFIYSYVRYEDDLINGIKNKYYNEVLKFKPVNPSLFQLETFIKQDTEFNHLFSKLVQEDFFGWLKPESNEREQLIVEISGWLDIPSLLKDKKIKDKVNVIYYLIDEAKKEIYIGSADKLGDRVIVGRKEIPGWNKFRYDNIKTEYKHLKQRVENQIINAFAMFLESNLKNVSPFSISKYKLVNKTCYHR
jgi:hypothetical protein